MYEVLRKIIEEIFVSEDMQVYLCDHIEELQKWQIVNMISGAMISLQRKVELFKMLVSFEDLEQELLTVEDDVDVQYIKRDSYEYRAAAIEEALAQLVVEGKEDGLLLLVELEQVDGDDRIRGNVPFYSYEKLMQYLKEEEPDEISDEDKDNARWYIIEKYQEDEAGELTEKGSFVYYRGEFLFFDGMGYEFGIYDDFGGSPDLNLPVPFKPGDIISIDSRPFGEKKNALVLMIGDNWDCCCIRVLFVNKEGILETSTLKHSSQFYKGEKKLMVSPLYSASICKEKCAGSKDEALIFAKWTISRCEYCGFLLDDVVDTVKISADEGIKEIWKLGLPTWSERLEERKKLGKEFARSMQSYEGDQKNL